MRLRAGCRRASTLVLALLALSVAFVLGMAAMRRSIHAVRSAAWSRDRLALRLLEESAVAELHAAVQAAAADPAHPAFRLLRAQGPPGPAPIPELGIPVATEQAA